MAFPHDDLPDGDLPDADMPDADMPDFLGGDATGGDFLGAETGDATLAARLDARRPAIARWTAAALLARRPDVARYRGVKGRRAWEQDLDVVLRRLHTALVQGAAGLGVDAPWLSATFAQRGVDEATLAAGADTLREALVRHLGAADGVRLVGRLDALPGGWRPAWARPAI